MSDQAMCGSNRTFVVDEKSKDIGADADNVQTTLWGFNRFEVFYQKTQPSVLFRRHVSFRALRDIQSGRFGGDLFNEQRQDQRDGTEESGDEKC